MIYELCIDKKRVKNSKISLKNSEKRGQETAKVWYRKIFVDRNKYNTKKMLQVFFLIKEA